MEILEHHEFRVTRNEDVEIEEDDTESIIQALEKELLRRRFGPPIRLEISDDMDDVTLGLLMQELEITEQEVYRLPAPLDLGGLFELQRIDRPDLMFPKRIPTTSVSLLPSDPTEKPDIFASIARGDILLHHPYESFATSVQAFLEQAAADPNVLAIKQTLYRTSGDSPIIEALIDAAEAGKAVLALVEIKARFDEQANISWARKLEKAGVHVVYGMVGLKTHCKLALVVRQERDGSAQALQPHRHGQLQPEDQPHLRGPRAADRRRPGRQRPDPPVQRAVGLRDREEVQAAARRPAPPAQGAAQADRHRGDERARRASRAGSA